MKSFFSRGKNYLAQKFEKVRPLNTEQIFYRDGIFLGNFADGPAKKALFETAEKIYNQEMKEGFRLEQKYRGSVDLRPNVHSYDDCFLDILRENSIPEKLEELTGVKLCLGHIQLRIADLATKSYIDWHRDTHFYKSQNPAGHTPPVVKLIIYPLFGDEGITLKALKGSHIRFHDTLKEDMRFIKNNKQNIVDIQASNNHFLIFSTGLLHSAQPPMGKSKSMRIIYSFCTERQLSHFAENSDLHRKYQLLTSRIQTH